jgi:hypothetical protein
LCDGFRTVSRVFDKLASAAEITGNVQLTVKKSGVFELSVWLVWSQQLGWHYLWTCTLTLEHCEAIFLVMLPIENAVEMMRVCEPTYV